MPPAAAVVLPVAKPTLAAMMTACRSLSASMAKAPSAATCAPSPTEASAAVPLSTTLTPPPMASVLDAPTAVASATDTSHTSPAAAARTVTSPAASMTALSPTEADASSERDAIETTAPTPALAVPMLAEPAITRVFAPLSARTARLSPPSFSPSVRRALSPIAARTWLAANSAAIVPATLAAAVPPGAVLMLPETAST